MSGASEGPQLTREQVLEEQLSPEIDQILARLDAGIAAERRAMDNVLFRLARYPASSAAQAQVARDTVTATEPVRDAVQRFAEPVRDRAQTGEQTRGAAPQAGETVQRTQDRR